MSDSQLDIFTVPLSEIVTGRMRHLHRLTDPTTSAEAAGRHVKSGRNATQCASVLAVIRSAPGLTSREIARAMGADRHMVARRTSDLERRGLACKGQARACSVGAGNAVTWLPTNERET